MNMIHPIVKGFALENGNSLFWFTALLHIEPCNDCSVVRNHYEDHFSHTSPHSSFKLRVQIRSSLWHRSHPHSYSFHITSTAMPSSSAFMTSAGGELSHVTSDVDFNLWPNTQQGCSDITPCIDDFKVRKENESIKNIANVILLNAQANKGKEICWSEGKRLVTPSVPKNNAHTHSWFQHKLFFCHKWIMNDLCTICIARDYTIQYF